jgi:integrase
MARSRIPIDRRLPPVEAGTCSNVVIFMDSWGEISRTYDLSKLVLPVDVITLLSEAFRQHHATSTVDTRRHCWFAIRAFARFASEEGGIRSAGDLTTAAIGRYTGWLDRQRGKAGESWTRTSRANMLMALRQLINWTKRRHPERLPSRIDFPPNPYPNRTVEPRSRFGADQLKVILRACYEEIDAAWARFETGRAILASNAPMVGIDPELCGLIRQLAQTNGGVLPQRITLAGHAISMSAVARHGGVRLLGSYLHLTGETLVPFFIAIAVQTAANPDPLRLIRRDCQAPHPLDENRLTIEWAKPRAGSTMKRTQRRSFDRRRTYAVPNLIDKVLAMTAPLVALARRQDRELLFLIRSEKKRIVTVMPSPTLVEGVKRFIARSNQRIAIWNQAAPDRPRASVPEFATMFLRGSVATEHYKAAGGDILAARDLLNHARVDTTETYIKGPETQRMRAETIARLQRLMISWLTGGNGSQNSPPEMPAFAEAATIGPDKAAAFGHDCLNPFAGVAPGSAPGRLCSRFAGCLRCPGLVIPIDVGHLARILQARDALENARTRLDPRRWDLLYAPSHRALIEDILPDFPGALYPAAETLSATLPHLPALE